MSVAGGIYSFICDGCGYRDRHYIERHQMGWNFVCPSCKRGMYVLTRRARKFRNYSFEPFVTEEITGDPIEIRSPEHREAVLAEHGLTQDRYSDLESRKRRHREDSLSSNQITFDQVVAEAKRRGRRVI